MRTPFKIGCLIFFRSASRQPRINGVRCAFPVSTTQVTNTSTHTHYFGLLVKERKAYHPAESNYSTELFEIVKH